MSTPRRCRCAGCSYPTRLPHPPRPPSPMRRRPPGPGRRRAGRPDRCHHRCCRTPREGPMAEINTDAAQLALAAVAEFDGSAPIADRYREEQALRVATFTDLDLPTARRVVEV